MIIDSHAHYNSSTYKNLFRYLSYDEGYNLSSQKLCERLGMRREGVFRELVSFVNDTDGNPIYENTMQYATLKKEWDVLKKGYNYGLGT